MKQTRVKRLVIELSGKDVELTIGQARELHAALNELFEEKVREVIKDRPYPVPQPYPVPDPYPVIPWRGPWVWPRRGPVWQTNSGTSFTLTDDATVHCQLKSG